ncbi:MAG: extracellular solute-binding protein, partial [Propionibacteriaceae bacterium]|nr:extracellular solute-binding protein [Propionibacteriaceae bacterium]
MRITPSRLAPALALGAGLALLAGCAPGATPGSSGTTGATTVSPASLTTDPAEMGDVTLVVWDQEVRGGQNDEIEALNAAFHAQYPNITIDRHAQSFDDLQKTGRLALTGPDAPDVIEANNTRSQMGTFVQAGQLLALDSYAAAYGWTTRYPATVLALSSYSADGKTFGSGQLYGLPQIGEVVGFYYNKAKLAALGLTVPATWADLEAALATAKQAGETPVMLGDLDKWPAVHVFGVIQGAHVAPAEIHNLVMGNAGADWTDQANVAAATELQDWVNKGYFNSDVLGSDDSTFGSRFATGEGVFYLGGSWYAPELAAGQQAQFGFFAPPPAQAGAGSATTGGTSLPFAITAASAHPDAAAAYIDFLNSTDAMTVIADKGNLPVINAAALAPASGT